MAGIMHREDFTPCPESVFYPSIIYQSINHLPSMYLSLSPPATLSFTHVYTYILIQLLFT